MAELKLSNDIIISYHDSGSGIPILFLHSFGHNKNLWFPQLTHFLQRGFRVLAPDMPGHGDSSYDPAHHGVDRMAQCYIELLDALDLFHDAPLRSLWLRAGSVRKHERQYNDLAS